MTASHGAYGNADATTAATSNAASSNGAASTDESLNARVRTSKSPRPNKWGIIIAAVVAIAIIVGAVAIFNGRNAQQSANKADTVTIGLKLAPPSLDIRRQSGSAIEQVLIGNVYEGLVSRDSDNKVQPGLASSWDISTDGTTYTFHLNRNMTFSNGDVLDADDVAWSINQLKEKQYYNANQVESLSKAEALDANTVRITLSSPDSNLLWYLTGRPGLVFDKDATYNAKTQAVGSGPYTVESFDSASKMVLKANPKYWGTAHKPATQHVVIDFITDDNAAVNALKSGDVDVLSPVNATLAKSLDANTYHVSASDGSDKFVLAFNCANKKLADKRVRQAIRYGINHKEIIASRGGVDTALGGPIPSVDPGYEDLTGLYPYDVAPGIDTTGDGQPDEGSLRGSSETVASRIRDEIQKKVSDAGIEIIEARITYLAYAPEIAAVMLQRQQASAIIDARKMIVDGAVGMVEMALERLAEKGTVELDEERKAAMVSNLLVVLCGNHDAQPVVNSGSLY